MTDRTTKQQLYFQLKLLCLNTKRNYSLNHWDTRYQLVVEAVDGTERSVTEHFLKLSDMYEVLYHINNLLEIDSWQEDKRQTKELTAEQFFYIRENLHNDKVIKVIDQ